MWCHQWVRGSYELILDRWLFPLWGSALERRPVDSLRGVIRSVTHLDRRDDEALIVVEGFHQLHVVFWQGKVKHLQVLLDPGGCHTFRDTHDTPLHVPPARRTPKIYQLSRGLSLVPTVCHLLVWLYASVSLKFRKVLCLTWVWPGPVFSGIAGR